MNNTISENIKRIKAELPETVTLVCVSKTYPADQVLEAYECDHLDFGENKVQELVQKHEELPKNIRWHLIGHLQRNKVKYIAPFVHLIHAVDSIKLLKEINKQGEKNNRTIKCLLQIHIAKEETKFGFSAEEFKQLDFNEIAQLSNVEVCGVMGMATNTENTDQVRSEFKLLNSLFTFLKTVHQPNIHATTLSMGMSSDYPIAIEEGSTLVRVGSAIFGARNYL